MDFGRRTFQIIILQISFETVIPSFVHLEKDRRDPATTQISNKTKQYGKNIEAKRERQHQRSSTKDTQLCAAESKTVGSLRCGDYTLFSYLDLDFAIRTDPFWQGSKMAAI